MLLRRNYRYSSVFAVCALVGVLTVASAASARKMRDPMKGYYDALMPRFPDVQEVPIGDSVGEGGAKTRMSYFMTAKKDVYQVADFYEAFWRRRGLWVTTNVTHRGGTLSAVDSRSGQVYQVLLHGSAKGPTHVFPSVNDIQRHMGGGQREINGVVLYDDSQVLLNIATDVGPHRGHTLASTNAGSVKENVDHYRDALVAAGYTKDMSNRCDVTDETTTRPCVLVFRDKKGAEVSVNISRLDKEHTRVLIMAIQ